jgi:hypothetical protein
MNNSLGIDKIIKMKMNHSNIEYQQIENDLLPRLKKAVMGLALKLPNRRIELYCGGMGTNLGLSIYNKGNKLVSHAYESLNTLQPHYRGYNKLFKSLISLQNDFNDYMALGYYPDFGIILYNPITETIEHNNAILKSI